MITNEKFKKKREVIRSLPLHDALLDQYTCMREIGPRQALSVIRAPISKRDRVGWK
jgi:hypothetical protein